MTNRTEFDDDGAPLRRATPPPSDFTDTRPGIVPDAQVWGDAPRRDLEAVEEVLDTVLGRFAAPERTALQHIAASWDEVCGPSWSEAEPVRCDGDTLIVEVSSGLVASRLQFDTTRVLAGLREGPARAIRRIRFRVRKA
jgi:hypothetical protein